MELTPHMLDSINAGFALISIHSLQQKLSKVATNYVML